MMDVPRIAAFPKGFFQQLLDRTEWSLADWIRAAARLGIDGVELYPGFLDGRDASYLAGLRNLAAEGGLSLPMMCASPDFIDPRPGAWERAIADERALIDIMVELNPHAGWRSVRVLSGQRWPTVSLDEGVERVVEAIETLLPYAEERRVTLVMENHYKDGLWLYPEFAQSSGVFLTIVRRIASPWFGVNFDPSNALIAGEDPLVLLDQVLDRVMCMHASDRSLRPGYTLADLNAHRGVGYPEALQHGVVGTGLNNYHAILSRMANRGFTGWISIEDGERGGSEGMEDIAASARFLRSAITEVWGGMGGEDNAQASGASIIGPRFDG